MMIGYGFSHAGGPEVIDAIDLPTPQPGPHEIQIKTSAIGLNNRDRMARQLGGSGLTVPGYDVAGTVTALGSSVSQFKVGDRVVARTTSAYAEIVTAAADMSVLLPASITPEKG
ncbi:NADPH:quinone reductase-like Zn-dependent oxidoreductase, partial [Lacticaseibacillus rhamnosus MTCC 5462]